MEGYRSIINTTKRPQLSQNSTRKPHYCDGETWPHNNGNHTEYINYFSVTDIGSRGSFDITTALINIHGRDKKQQEIVDLNSRLRAMLSIVKKQLNLIVT